MTLFEEVILAYVEAWTESDEEKRRALLQKSWAEDAIYSDPAGQAVGREALVKHIGSIQQRRPGYRVLITSGIDEHHGQLRFTWARVNPEGQRVAEGIDFGEVGSDSRLTRITGFFGPQLPMPSSWPATVTG